MLHFCAFLLILPTICFALQNVSLSISRPRIHEEPPNFYGFINTPMDYLLTARVSYFEICDQRLLAMTNISFQWIFSDPNTGAVIRDATSEFCYHKWQAPYEGNFTLKVNIFDISHALLASVEKEFLVQDLWIAALGDSFASGQGNPDKAAELMGIIPAQWISKSCYRSGHGSWAYRTYMQVARKFPNHGILFTYLACSGASITNGLLKSKVPWELSQLDQLSAIQARANAKFCDCPNCCESRIKPDAILLSIGGNDIDYSNVLFSILWGDSNRMFREMPTNLKRLEQGLGLLGRQLPAKIEGFDPKSLFYPHYFDLSRNEKGNIDGSCPGLYSATTEKFSRAHKEVLQRGNGMISRAGAHFNWTIVENIENIFRFHGVCSKKPYIRSIEDSFTLQGNCYGAFHPTTVGHVKVAKRVSSKLVKYLREKLSTA